MPPVPMVRVVRSGLTESTHAGDLAVADAGGGLVAWAGDPDLMIYARSSMKPLQATVSLSFLSVELSDPQVAVMCASHNGEPVHVDVVRTLLDACGVGEESLLCPSVLPGDRESIVGVEGPARIYSDCSGKHSGMLGACREQEWSLPAYREPDHPLQQAVLRAVLRATGRESVRIGVDGCGVPVHGLPLRAMATIYARLADPRRLGDLEPFARRATGAMRAEPYLVAGRGRVDTALMRARPGLVVKSGAEGLICAALPERGLGFALKMRDGSGRGGGPAMIRCLIEMGILDRGALGDAGAYARPVVTGGGSPVGDVIAGYAIERS